MVVAESAAPEETGPAGTENTTEGLYESREWWDQVARDEFIREAVRGHRLEFQSRPPTVATWSSKIYASLQQEPTPHLAVSGESAPERSSGENTNFRQRFLLKRIFGPEEGREP